MIVLLGAPLACSSSGPRGADGQAPDAPDGQAPDAPGEHASDAPGATCVLHDPSAHADAGSPPFDSGQPVDALSASCGKHDGLGAHLYGSTDGVDLGASYDGPAVIERSTPSELVIAHQPAGMPFPLHTTVLDLGPVPMLPVGAQVWLSTDYHVSIIVSDRQNGRRLFGSVRNPGVEAPSPFPIAIHDTCTTVAPLCAGTIVYGTIDVTGDTVVSIYDSETRTVTVDGVDYDVRVTAQNEWDTGICGDQLPARGASIEFRAHDLACLAASLPHAPLPACAVGNDDVSVSLTLEDATPDGAVFYRGRSDISSSCYDFDRVAGVRTTLPAFELCADPGIFPEPAPGQEFWLTSSRSSGSIALALREPQRGPVLIGRVDVWLPTGTYPVSVSDAEAVLGIGVEADPRCEYGNGNAIGRGTLWDVVFDTPSPTHVQSETITPVQIGGRDYEVWSSGQDSEYLWFVVYR